jgi:hypothetical protein
VEEISAFPTVTGKKVTFPVSINRRLRGQPEEKLANILIGHYGISWPDLDEDLSHAGLRSGRLSTVN